eukprot:1761761-Amphidinium_carterae.1
MKKKSGLGLDALAVPALNHLPLEALASLAEEMNEWQRLGQWPRQLLHQIVVLLAKPSGGERPITLLPM